MLIIRQRQQNPTLVFLMGAIRSDHTLKGWRNCNSFKRSQLTVQVGEGRFQHLAVARVARSLQLLSYTLAGKGQTLSFAIALPLLGRHHRTRSLRLLQALLLLLFDRLTLPTACHFGKVYIVFVPKNVGKYLIVTIRWIKLLCSGKGTTPERRTAEPEGASRPGE